MFTLKVEIIAEIYNVDLYLIYIVIILRGIKLNKCNNVAG